MRLDVSTFNRVKNHFLNIFKRLIEIWYLFSILSRVPLNREQ